MLKISIYMLGIFHVKLGETPVEGFRSERERALLAYLANRPSHQTQRNALFTLLWPDWTEDQARNNLRVTLHRLRKLFTLKGNEYLLVERDSVRLNPEVEVWTDATAMEDIFQKAEALVADRRAYHTERIVILQQGIEYYRGEFLQGIQIADSQQFTDWVVQKQGVYHHQVLTALSQITEVHLRRGELDLAIKYAQRQLELEPWREEAHRQLMVAFAYSGQTSAALAQYENCRRVLEEELGVAPAGETEAEYARLKTVRLRVGRDLPKAPKPFIGRKEEQAEIISLLADPTIRILTLTGLGGIGKTRLALAIAYNLVGAFLDGVVFVPLNMYHNNYEIPKAIATQLNFTFVRHKPDGDQLSAYLAEKEMLLVMDNFDHLINGAEFLTTLLNQAPGVKFIATSRQRLGLREEIIYDVRGFDLGGERDNDATQMFMERAQALNPGYNPDETELQGIRALCDLVGGIPLALELAAPWTRVLRAGEIQEEIENNLEFLTSDYQDIAPQHRSMAAVFESTWQTLTASQQRILGRFSIFRAPFTRQAAEQVAGAKLSDLTVLLDKALIRQEVMWGEEVRYNLHELLKQFLSDKLAAQPDQLHLAQESMARYYLKFTNRYHALLFGPRENEAIQAVGLEYANIRPAILWTCSQSLPTRLEKYLWVLMIYYEGFSLFREAEKTFEEIIQRMETARKNQSRIPVEFEQDLAQAYAFHAWDLMRLGRLEEANQENQRALELAKKSGNVEMEAQVLNSSGVFLQLEGEFEKSNQFFLEAYEKFKALGSTWHLGGCKLNLGHNAIQIGNLPQAEEYLQTANELFMEIEHYWGLSNVRRALAELVMNNKDYQAAEKFLIEGLSYAERGHHKWNRIKLLVTLGNLAYIQEDWETARGYYQESLVFMGQFGDQELLVTTKEKYQKVLAQSATHSNNLNPK